MDRPDDPAPQPPPDGGPEARESPRTQLETAVRVELTGTHVQGTTRNVSENGVLLVTPEQLVVTVEYIDGDQPVTRRGRIVRVQGLAGGAIGIAVSFETEG